MLPVYVFRTGGTVFFKLATRFQSDLLFSQWEFCQVGHPSDLSPSESNFIAA